MIPDIPSRRISEGLGFCDHKLGRNVQTRQKNYRNWFVGQGDASDLTELRNGLQTGTPVGNKKYIREIETKLQQKVGFARRGGP